MDGRDFQTLDQLFQHALASLTQAAQSGRLVKYEYQYLLISLHRPQHPWQLRALCLDLIGQFKPIGDA
jgi:hypothetical protein